MRIGTELTEAEQTDVFWTKAWEGWYWETFIVNRCRNAGLPADDPDLPRLAVTPEEVTWLTRNQRDIRIGRAGFFFEHKSRPKLRFTCPEDWPERLNPVLVDGQYGWDAKVKRPAAVAITSGITRVTLVVPISSRSYWTVQEQRDNRLKYSYQAYCVDRSYLRPWSEFEAFMQSNFEEGNIPWEV